MEGRFTAASRESSPITHSPKPRCSESQAGLATVTSAVVAGASGTCDTGLPLSTFVKKPDACYVLNYCKKNKITHLPIAVPQSYAPFPHADGPPAL